MENLRDDGDQLDYWSLFDRHVNYINVFFKGMHFQKFCNDSFDFQANIQY